MKDYNGDINDIDWHPNGKLIVSGSSKIQAPIVWDSDDGSFIKSLPGHSDLVTIARWSPDGRKLASITDIDGKVIIWDGITGSMVRTLDGHIKKPSSIDWSPDGLKIAISSASDSSVLIWNAINGRLINRFTTGSCHETFWSPQGDKLATSTENATIQIWNPNNGKEILTITGHISNVSTFCWSPDGRYIATGNSDKAVKIWDATNGALVNSFYGHRYGIYSVKWSPDGNKIASGSDDDVVLIWDAANGNIIQRCYGPIRPIWSVSWSPDGQSVASGSSDYTIRAWAFNDEFIQEDLSDSLFEIIEPEAKSDNLYLGECYLNYHKDSLVTSFIINTGKCKIRIDSIVIENYAQKCFSVLAPKEPFIIEPGDSKDVEFRFTPDRKDYQMSTIKIYTQSGVINERISGAGLIPMPSLSAKKVDFGKVRVFSYKDTLVYLVENRSLFPVTIFNVKVHAWYSDPFELLRNDIFTMMPGEKKEIGLRFKPQKVGLASGLISFVFDSLGGSISGELYGTGIKSLVHIPDDSAYAGDRRSLKLVFNDCYSDSIQDLAAKVKARIRFEKSILAPEDQNGIYLSKNDSTFYYLESPIGESNILAEIPVVAGLGSVSETSVDIESFDFYDASGNVVDMDVEKQSGVFKLLGICPEGGNRLVNTSGNAQILSIVPNPASGSIGVEVELIESGETRLIMGDILGNEVKTLYSGTVSEFGKRTVNADVSNLPSGVYTVILQTPTVRQSAIIIKK